MPVPACLLACSSVCSRLHLAAPGEIQRGAVRAAGCGLLLLFLLPLLLLLLLLPLLPPLLPLLPLLPLVLLPQLILRLLYRHRGPSGRHGGHLSHFLRVSRSVSPFPRHHPSAPPPLCLLPLAARCRCR